MLHVTTGHFHPELEETLALDLQSIKARDPFGSIIIVVPSEALRDRLKWFLAHECHIPLLNVHILTFHHLAIRLLQEGEPETRFPIRSHVFFQELIHQRLKECPDESQEWKDLIEVPGAWAALWATFKDMKDAKVNAANIREMITQEGGAYASDVQRVVNLYELVVEEGTPRRNLDRDDMALLAESRVRTSPFLHRQEAIVYYGFYDLTQVQLDVFQHIARLYPTHLYFPLVLKHEAFLFAENFFQRYASGLQSQSTRVLPQNRTFSGLRRVFADPHTKDSSFLNPMPQQSVDPAGDVQSGEDEHRGFSHSTFSSFLSDCSSVREGG